GWLQSLGPVSQEKAARRLPVPGNATISVRKPSTSQTMLRGQHGVALMTTNPRPLALVTGASSGIGAQLARELARDGHDLILCARRVERMQALADEFKAMGAACTIIAADLGKSGAAAGLVQEIEAKGLVVDVLINAAGLGGQGRFYKSDPQRIGEMLQLN